MTANAPDFFLGSSEHRGEWSLPRACWIQARINDDNGGEYLLVRINPPVIGQTYGLGEHDIADLIIAPHCSGATLFPLSRFPLPVYVYRILDRAIADDFSFNPSRVEMVAWCEIYRKEEDAKAHANLI